MKVIFSGTTEIDIFSDQAFRIIENLFSNRYEGENKMLKLILEKTLCSRNIMIFGVGVLAILMAMPADAQYPNPIWQIDTSSSSEWEATAFNGGRRVVRDADGFLHTVFHSLPAGAPPTGTQCSIYYSHSILPCSGYLQPAQVDWSAPEEIAGVTEHVVDNRYPSIAIEHGSSSSPKGNDILHVVWQRDPVGSGGDYEICYMNTMGDSFISGGTPAVWSTPTLIWNTTSHHDLVPSIAINKDNHIHIVWQTEAWDGDSEILYVRSTDGGTTFTDEAGNLLSNFGGGALPYNLSNNTLSSQCPSIACMIDETPERAIGSSMTAAPYVYNSTSVHVVWHDKTDATGGAGDYNIFYTHSGDDGKNWDPAENVSAMTSRDRSIYTSIAVDYFDQPHIAYMHNCTNDHDPEPPGPGNYLAGINPLNPVSFPGPDPNMYGTLMQIVEYTYRTPPGLGGTWQTPETLTLGSVDDEFPSIAIDCNLGLHVAWQSWGSMIPSPTGQYTIMKAFKGFNWSTPYPSGWPIGTGNWTIYELSSEIAGPDYWDDLFPSIAPKKVSMFTCSTQDDFDLVWTRINGVGSDAAIDAINQEIWYSGGTTWSDPPVIPPTPTPAATSTPTATPTTPAPVSDWDKY